MSSARLHIGRVTGTSTRRLSVDVFVPASNRTITDVAIGAGVGSAMLGIRCRFVPQVGTGIIVLESDSGCFAFGYYPEVWSNPALAGQATTLDGERQNYSATEYARLSEGAGSTDFSGNSTPPVDLVPGEIDLTDASGTGVQLLMGLSRLKAGDRAVIEACNLNDMVRIVSDVYRNYTAFGDFEVFRDGNTLNVEWLGTSYSHEAWGKKLPTDPLATVADGDTTTPCDFDSSQSPEDTGRWRFMAHVGHLADFMQLFFTDPVKTLGTDAASAIGGKARFAVGPQGELILQSTNSIVLERVTRVIVPMKKKRYDDGTGQRGDAWDSYNKDPLKVWDYRGGSMADAAYQLREQARWLANYHSLARYTQSSKGQGDWHVPSSEADTAIPDAAGGEIDRQEVVSADYIEVYSTYRIMEDGSHVLLDGYGSAVVCSGGDVSVTASKNLRLGAAGNVTIEAGQDILCNARRNTELVSQVGGTTVKAATWLSVFCTHGHVWMRSDATPGTDGLYPGGVTEEDASEWQRANDPTIRLPDDQAIVVEAGRGGASFKSCRNFRVRVSKDFTGDINPDRPAPDTNDGLQLVSEGRADVVSEDNLRLVSRKGFLTLGAAKDFLVRCNRAFIDALRGTIALGRQAIIRQGTLNVPVVSAQTTMSSSVMTSSGQVGTINRENNPMFPPSYLGGKETDLDEPLFVSEADPDGVTLDKAPSAAISERSPSPRDFSLGMFRPGYAPVKFYMRVDGLIESHTEQFIADVGELSNDVAEKFEKWSPAQPLDMLHVDPSRRFCAPGRYATNRAYLSGNRLDIPSETPTNNFAASLVTIPRELYAMANDHLHETLIPDDIRRRQKQSS